MKIHLPNSAFLGNIDAFLRLFEPSQPNELHITANKNWISVHPVVLTLIASLGQTIPSEKITCEKLEAKSKHYLERMGLFKYLGINSGIKVVEHEPAGRFIPLTTIRNSDELSGFMTEMIPLLHLQPKQAESIRYIISELVRNVLEHASSRTGAILAAQYFTKTNTIRIGIADTGLGIKNTINHSYDAKTHLDAIKLALTPGITGTTTREGGTERNAGAGLFFVKSIATVNRNFFVIYSGDSMYKLLKNDAKKKGFRLFANPFKDKHSKREDLPFWQGTVVGIDITLDNTSEFSMLLDLIRDTYHEAVQERKRARYKKAKFI